jgi:hypothetical protein
MKWEPIETAPKNGNTIDVWAGGGRVTDVYWRSSWRGEGWHCMAEDDYGNNRWTLVEQEHGTPTHWMPLPEPPTP